MQTLPKNIADNENYPNREYIVLDYNSTDGLKDWIMSEMEVHLRSGLLKYFRTEARPYFDRCHSRNMVFKQASGDIFCNVDADNFTGPGFANYLNHFFKEQPCSFLTPDYSVRDVMGRLSIKRSDFHDVKGFNESLEGYGFDDVDLYRRLELRNKKHKFLYELQFLQAINHPHGERFKNELTGMNLQAIYIAYLKPWKSELLFIYRDGTFDLGTFIDNEVFKTDLEQSAVTDPIVILSGKWIKGYWTQQDKDLILSDNGRENVFKNEIDTRNYILNGQQFYQITDRELFEELVLTRTELDNREKYLYYCNEENIGKVNAAGYGLGTICQLTNT
jgi:hypothetical protein